MKTTSNLAIPRFRRQSQESVRNPSVSNRMEQAILNKRGLRSEVMWKTLKYLEEGSMFWWGQMSFGDKLDDMLCLQQTSPTFNHGCGSVVLMGCFVKVQFNECNKIWGNPGGKSDARELWFVFQQGCCLTIPKQPDSLRIFCKDKRRKTSVSRCSTLTDTYPYRLSAVIAVKWHLLNTDMMGINT